MKKHLNMTISGKVQGVSYRLWAQKKANELDLKGFVQNMQNGSVYLEIEGDEYKLNMFIHLCYKGPKNSDVSGIKFYNAKLCDYKNFKIRY